MRDGQRIREKTTPSAVGRLVKDALPRLLYLAIGIAIGRFVPVGPIHQLPQVPEAQNPVLLGEADEPTLPEAAPAMHLADTPSPPALPAGAKAGVPGSSAADSKRALRHPVEALTPAQRAPAAAGEYTLSLGLFDQILEARAFCQQLGRRGYPVGVAPELGRHAVHLGRFDTAAQAQSFADKLRHADIDAQIHRVQAGDRAHPSP